MEWKLAAHGSAPANEGRPDGFEEQTFGQAKRLVWARGASAIVGPIAYWKRFAVMAANHTLTVVDADRPDAVAITVDHVVDVRAIGSHAGALWLELAAGILAVPLADLERLAREAPAETSITVATWHPHRNAFARVPAKVVWVSGHDALVNIQEPRVRQIHLDASVFGLDKGMHLAFVDQLWPGAYTAVDVPGQPRRTVQAPAPLRTATASAVRIVPRDPAAGAWDSIARTGPVLALVEQIAAAPDDAVARAVLLDALGDAGEPCAATFALLGAGKRVSAQDRAAALGPLVHFLADLKLHGGLPASGTLVAEPPADPAATAAFLGDVRLAMLHTVRIGKGPEPLYRALVGSPGLVGLRRADGSTHALLQELRDRRAGQLTHLFGVPYTNKLALSYLSAPAFASVRHLELVVRGRNVARRARDVVDELATFAGPERHVAFVTPRTGDAELLARRVIPSFRALGLASVAIGGVTLARTPDGIAVRVEPDAEPVIAELARARFERAATS
ncbi:MAG: hypothetical protein ABI467_18230 [Kofleriaceae bacterium]